MTAIKFYFQNTHSYIKLFLQHGMASQSNLQRKFEEFTQFLDKLHLSTRFLHSLCCHSKVFLKHSFFSTSIVQNCHSHILFTLKTIKDTAIIALIPQLRETLSQLLYKVQAAAVGSNVSSAFWAGNLKNKDMNGDEILSQARITSKYS